MARINVSELARAWRGALRGSGSPGSRGIAPSPGESAEGRLRTASRVAALVVAALGLAGCIAGAAIGDVVASAVFGAVVALLAATAVVLGAERVHRGVTAPLGALADATDQGTLDHMLMPVLGAPSELRRVADAVRNLMAARTLAEREAALRQFQAEQLAGEVHGMVETANTLGASTSLAVLLEAIGKRAMVAGGSNRCVVWLAENSDARGEAEQLVVRFDSAAANPLSPEPNRVGIENGRRDGSQTSGVGSFNRVAKVAERREIVVQSSLVPRELAQARLRASTGVTGGEVPVAEAEMHQVWIGVPLEVGGRLIGVMELAGIEPRSAARDGQGFAERHRMSLMALAPQAAAMIDAFRAGARAELLLRMDPVSGLGNHRQFVNDLTVEVERANRYNRPLGVVMGDIDGFRCFNEESGRASGDRVLASVGEIIEREARASDTAYRFGGDEFVILARESDEDACLGLARRLAIRLAEAEIPFADGGVSACFGIAQLELPGDGEEMMAQVAAALTVARDSGPGAVVSWGQMLRAAETGGWRESAEPVHEVVLDDEGGIDPDGEEGGVKVA